MDRSQATGLILISLLLVIYFWFLAPDSSQKDATSSKTSKQSESNEIDTEEVFLDDSVSLDSVESRLGHFKFASHGNEKLVVLENEDIRVTFSSKGGVVKKVLLKKYKTFDGEPLILLDEQSSRFNLWVETEQGAVDIASLYYDVVYEGKNTVSFILKLTKGAVVKHTYTIGSKGYELTYDLITQGKSLKDVITGDTFVLHWQDQLKHLEKDIEQSRRKAKINYYTANGDFEDIDGDVERDTLDTPLKWVGFKQKFFTSAIIADEAFGTAALKIDTDEGDSTTVKDFAFTGNIPWKDVTNGEQHFTYYFGPNHFQIMKGVTDGFSRNVYLGWKVFSWINQFLIIPIFNLLESFIGNYGIIIIILVLIIKLLLFPLSYKSYVSMAKTKVLKPELDKIKERLGNDLQAIQQEQMKLYRQVGVNPLSGCIPMLLQMPILFAMFNFFPNSIELRQESFLWAQDLSTYDAILSWSQHIPLLSDTYGNHVSLFTLLMTASTILYTWSNNQVSAMQGPTKYMSYFMPLIFMFVLNSFPAGLSFYYFVSNIVTFGQQTIIRRFVDEEKIKLSLEENRKKNSNKGKSSFRQKVDAVSKAKITTPKKDKKNK